MMVVSKTFFLAPAICKDCDRILKTSMLGLVNVILGFCFHQMLKKCVWILIMGFKSSDECCLYSCTIRELVAENRRLEWGCECDRSCWHLDCSAEIEIE